MRQQNFKSWLWGFLKEDSPIGDLARDAKADAEWRGRSAKSLEERLNQMGACRGAKATMAKAKAMFHDS